MNKAYLVLFILINLNSVFSQSFNIEEFNIKRLAFIGVDSKQLLFYKYKITGDDRRAILALEPSGEKFNLFVKEDKFEGHPMYYDQVLSIYGFPYDKKLLIKYMNRDSIFPFNSPVTFRNFSIGSFPNSDIIFISAYSDACIYIFNKKTFEFYPLPLIGGDLHVKGDYLFFETLRYSDNFSDFPENIYRVHKNDLKNPELILIQVEEEWHPYGEDVIYARTFPKIGECENKKCQGAFYNIATNKFSVEPRYIPTHKFIEIDGKSKILDILEEDGREVFQLKDIPNPPQSFPHKMKDDYTQKPRGTIFKYYNIPLKEKTLPGTFINHDILYRATEEALRQLTKEQLRLLRNTFFAFQGYKFESDDLNEFFSQFEWYQKMSMGDKSNDDVVIWPDEKIRVDLILEIEESK